VKNSRKYYDDASQVLVELMISTTRPDLHLQLSTRAPLVRPRVRGVRETITSLPMVSSMLGISNSGERRRSQEDASVAAVTSNRRGSPSPSLENKQAEKQSGKWSIPVLNEQGQSTIAEESGRMSPSESTGSLDLDKVCAIIFVLVIQNLTFLSYLIYLVFYL